eukprot:g15643.t1
MGQAVRCLWLAAVFLANSEEVVELDGQNFTWAMRAYPRLLLFFYAPWCGHSRSLDPEVRRAAAELQAGGHEGRSLWFPLMDALNHTQDASMEVEIADEFGISAYPGLFLLQKGSYEEFTGRRSAAAIADWTRSKIGSALELVNNSDHALVATGDAGRQATVKRLAERFRTWGKFIFLAGGLHPRVQLFRGLDELLEGPASASEAEQKLVEFMQAHQLPLFGEVSEENFYHYETSGARGLLWVLFAESGGTPCSSRCRQRAYEQQEALRQEDAVDLNSALFHSEPFAPESPNHAKRRPRPRLVERPSSRSSTPRGALLTPKGEWGSSRSLPTRRPERPFWSDGASDARPEEEVTEVKQPHGRRLSFVGVSLRDVWEAIQEEEPFLDWMPEFWDRVLTSPAPAACKTLSLRSMANWVAIYNRWQAVGGWKPGQAPQVFNAFEAKEMLGIPMTRVMEFVPRVSPLLAVCILMSTAISNKQKIRFLLGVFDENDNRTFEEEEFIAMLIALVRGMGAMFGMMNIKDRTSMTLGDPEIFEEETRKFRLSHTCPVDPPLEIAASLDATFLNRHEVIVARKLFDKCMSTGSFGMSHKICPKASAKHLRMFHNWIQEFDHVEDLKLEATRARQAQRRFKEYVGKPKLPAKIRQEISSDWMLRAPEQEFEDYVQAWCPPDFRPFDGHPLVDEVVGKLLENCLAKQEQRIKQKERLFASRCSERWGWKDKKGMLCPEVADFLCLHMAAESAFSRDGVLQMMSELKDFRPRT